MQLEAVRHKEISMEREKVAVDAKVAAVASREEAVRGEKMALEREKREVEALASKAAAVAEAERRLAEKDRKGRPGQTPSWVGKAKPKDRSASSIGVDPESGLLDVLADHAGIPQHAFDAALLKDADALQASLKEKFPSFENSGWRLESSYTQPMPEKLRSDLARFFGPHNELLYAFAGRRFNWPDR